MIKKDLRILTIVIKNVPHHDSGAYGETVDLLDYVQCENIAVRSIIQHNFELTDKEIHLFRSVLKLTLKEFGDALNVSDAAVLKWERGGKIPYGQKVLIKAFVRDKLGLVPLKYSGLIEFKTPHEVQIEYYKEDEFIPEKAA